MNAAQNSPRQVNESPSPRTAHRIMPRRLCYVYITYREQQLTSPLCACAPLSSLISGLGYSFFLCIYIFFKQFSLRPN